MKKDIKDVEKIVNQSLEEICGEFEAMLDKCNLEENLFKWIVTAKLMEQSSKVMLDLVKKQHSDYTNELDKEFEQLINQRVSILAAMTKENERKND